MKRHREEIDLELNRELEDTEHRKSIEITNQGYS